MAVFAACSHHKLPDPPPRVRSPIGILRRKALVIMIVSVKDYVHICVVERLPEGPQGSVIPVPPARAEERVMKIGHGASGGVLGEVLT